MYSLPNHLRGENTLFFDSDKEFIILVSKNISLLSSNVQEGIEYRQFENRSIKQAFISINKSLFPSFTAFCTHDKKKKNMCLQELKFGTASQQRTELIENKEKSSHFWRGEKL
jgi:hypothetical protein